MAKNNRQKNKKPSNKQASANPTGKPPKCGTSDKLHNGRSCRFCFIYSNISRLTNHIAGWCWNKSQPTRPVANCSHCGKGGHEERVCYEKNLRRKPKTPPSTSVTDSLPKIEHVRWVKAMNCQRQRDQSVVTFPLTLVV